MAEGKRKQGQTRWFFRLPPGGGCHWPKHVTYSPIFKVQEVQSFHVHGRGMIDSATEQNNVTSLLINSLYQVISEKVSDHLQSRW